MALNRQDKEAPIIGTEPQPQHQRLRLQVGQVCSAMLVDLDFADPVVHSETMYVDYIAAHHSRVLQEYWEEIGEPKYVRYPETWWDHLKLTVLEGKGDFLRGVVGRMRPVAYTVETLEPRAVFKHMDLPPGVRNSIQYYTVPMKGRRPLEDYAHG